MQVSKVTICEKRKGMNNTKPKTRRPDEYMRSELSCQSGGAEFPGLGALSVLEVH